MTSKYNLYDLIAVVTPGLLFLWGISVVTKIGTIPFTGGLADTSVLIVLSYVTGLVIQGISQIVVEKILIKFWGGLPSAKWLLDEDTTLSTDFKDRVKTIVSEKYSVDHKGENSKESRLKKNQEIFYLCYSAVENRKISDKPQIFNAQYGLFRCLLTVFIFLFLYSTTTLLFVSNIDVKSVAALLLASITGAFVSYFRVKKRADDFVRSVYNLFITHFSN